MNARSTLFSAAIGAALAAFAAQTSLFSSAAPAADNPTAGAHALPSPLTEPGNDAFGTIQEAIRALDADPQTNWSKVNLEALRIHLVDMHNMTLHVTVLAQKPIAGGVEVTVAPDSARVAASLDRVFAAHPRQLEAETGWKMAVRKQRGDYVMTVTTTNAAEVAKLRSLGYIGILATGAHHQAHHWAIARGLNPHHH